MFFTSKLHFWLDRVSETHTKKMTAVAYHNVLIDHLFYALALFLGASADRYRCIPRKTLKNPLLLREKCTHRLILCSKFFYRHD